MATYRDKIEKYEARLRRAEEIGLEPDEDDMKRLAYYLERAERKGLDHETKLKDKAHSLKKTVRKGWKGAKPLVMKAAVIIIEAKLRP